MKILCIIPLIVNKMSKYTIILLFVLLPVMMCQAQKKKAKTLDLELKPHGDVILNFIPVVDGKAFFIDSIYTAPGGERFKITNWKFFVSNIALSSSLGIEEPAIFENKLPVLFIDYSRANHSLVQFNTGDYTDVRFDVGLPRQLNHSDPTVALPPLDLAQQDMYWEWNSGYIFLLVEGQLADGDHERFHFAIGGDNKIMPFAHGNLFQVSPLIKVEKGRVLQMNFTFDFNKLLKNGDGSNYSLKSEKSRIVHGGYFADVLSLNAKYAIEFKSVELK